jgi:hypothetical protein
VTVANSAHPERVDIDDPGGLQGSADIMYNGDGTHTVSYTVPQTPNPNDPDLLTVRHTAETGAGGFSTEERLNVATIRFGGVRITTDPTTCLEPDDEPLQIEVDVDGEPELTWDASAGSISATGRFTPPRQSQVVTVTVALADNPEVSDSTDLQVGGCSCRAVVYVGGTSETTRTLRFFFNAELTGVQALDWRPGGPSQLTVGFGGSGQPAVHPGRPS